MSFICFRTILDAMDCVNWNCVELCHVFGNFQKPPGSVEDALGDSCLQNYFLGFLLCTAWRYHILPPGATNWFASVPVSLAVQWCRNVWG